jgi:hypothetical protein
MLHKGKTLDEETGMEKFNQKSNFWASTLIMIGQVTTKSKFMFSCPSSFL